MAGQPVELDCKIALDGLPDFSFGIFVGIVVEFRRFIFLKNEENYDEQKSISRLLQHRFVFIFFDIWNTSIGRELVSLAGYRFNKMS